MVKKGVLYAAYLEMYQIQTVVEHVGLWVPKSKVFHIECPVSISLPFKVNKGAAQLVVSVGTLEVKRNQ